MHCAHGVGDHLPGDRDQLGRAEPVQAAGGGADPQIALAVLEHRPHGLALHARQRVVATEVVGRQAAQAHVQRREPDIAVAVAVQAVDAPSVDRGRTRVALETPLAEERGTGLGADPGGVAGIDGQAVDGVAGQAVVLVVEPRLAVLPVDDADAVGGDPDATRAVGDDGAVEAAWRKAVGVAEQAWRSVRHPHHARVGGQPQATGGVVDDAEHALDAGGQRDRFQRAALPAVQAAVERADPQAALAVRADGRDGRTLQRRRHARVDGLEARAAVPRQSAIGRQPDGTVGLLGDGQHRALRQFVLVPDMGELANRPPRFQRLGGKQQERAQGADEQGAGAPCIKEHAEFRASVPPPVARHAISNLDNGGDGRRLRAGGAHAAATRGFATTFTAPATT